MKKIISFLTICVLFIFEVCIAQNIGINGTGATAHPSALLDLDASPTNNTGLLVPRLSTVQRNSIASPALSLFIFNTDNHCFESYETNTSSWVTLFCLGCSMPSAFLTASPSAITSNQFTANWTLSSGATSYSIDVATDASFTNFVAGFNNLNIGNTLNTTVTGLACGNYYYRVKASNNCGVSLSSTSSSVAIVNTGTMAFNYTGGIQTFTVPTCVNTITFKLWGAGGGCSTFTGNGIGGGGGYSTGSINVTAGQIFTIIVGGAGLNNSGNIGGNGGFGGGGNGGSAGGLDGGGGGGGRSTIRDVSNTEIITAGGGGGGNRLGFSALSGVGGAGGGIIGIAGTNGTGSTGGTGGTQSAGGISGVTAGNNGTMFQGGNGANAMVVAGGGGGGGYFGGGSGGGFNSGGSGSGGGGGGGSSYISGTGVFGASTIAGNSSIPGNNTDPQRVNFGEGATASSNQNATHGIVIISW